MTHVLAQLSKRIFLSFLLPSLHPNIMMYDVMAGQCLHVLNARPSPHPFPPLFQQVERAPVSRARDPPLVPLVEISPLNLALIGQDPR